MRGFSRRCPACGSGRIFAGYLTVAESCSGCQTGFSQFRADDAPPYFTMMIVGHLIVPLALIVERIYSPAVWVQYSLWLPLTLILTLTLLPRVKGTANILGYAKWLMDPEDPVSEGFEIF